LATPITQQTMRLKGENPPNVTVDSPSLKVEDGQRAIHVRHLGTVQILKPLVTPESEAASRRRNAKRTDRNYSQAYRGLSIVGGLLALLAVIASGIMFLGVQDPAAGGITATQFRRQSPLPKAPGTWVTLPSRVPPRLPVETVRDYRVIKAVKRDRRSVPTVDRPVLLARRVRIIKTPRLIRTRFVPTTLIIYAENGVIKSRIEPQLTAVYKKSPDLSR
jgi:hypothetical protein